MISTYWQAFVNKVLSGRQGIKFKKSPSKDCPTIAATHICIRPMSPDTNIHTQSLGSCLFEEMLPSWFLTLLTSLCLHFEEPCRKSALQHWRFSCVCLGCLTVEGERRLYWTRHLCLSYVRLVSELCAACPIKCLAGSVPHNMSCSSMPSPDYQHFMHIPHLHLIFLLFSYFRATFSWEWGLRLAPTHLWQESSGGRARLSSSNVASSWLTLTCSTCHP